MGPAITKSRIEELWPITLDKASKSTYWHQYYSQKHFFKINIFVLCGSSLATQPTLFQITNYNIADLYPCFMYAERLMCSSGIGG